MRLAMSSFSLFVVVFLTVGSAVTVYGEENCNITSNVSISLNKPDACPYEPVTAQCNVTGPSNLFLSWDCQASNERLVFCDQMAVDLDCEFGTVYDISSICVCSETVIISEATFDLSPMGDMMLFCSNGESDQRQGVPVSAKALSTPQLYCSTVDINNNVQYEARVWWIVNDTDTYNDVEYVVSVVNSSSPTPMDITTNQTQITLNLYYGVNYTIAVITKRCGGNVTSQFSEECLLYFPEISTGTAPAPTVTPMPPSRGSSNGEQLVGGLVGGLLAVTSLLIFAIGLFLCCRYKFCVKKQTIIIQEAVDLHLQAEGDFAWKKFDEDLKNLDGLEVTQSEKYTRITEDESQKRTGVGGIYVDGEFIYYSCIERKDETENFILRKCEHNGTFVCGVTCPAFIRGIGIDIDGFIYVLCSGSKSKVIKFDRDLNPLRVTHTNSSRHLNTPYGMLVTSDHVLVTADSEILCHLCVLDLNLNHHFNLKLSEGPIGITALDENKYIVTFKAAIAVIDINFDEKKYRETKVKCMRMKNGNNETFKAGPILRGICVSNQYILVTEVWGFDVADGRLLCLQYNEKSGQLKMVAAQDNFSNNCSQLCTERRNKDGKKCNAIVVTSYNGAIYYSQGSYGEMFHIVRAIVNGTSIDSNKLFDVPSI